MTTAPVTINKIAEVSYVYCREELDLIIVLEILLQSTMRATSTDGIRIILTQTPTTQDEDIIQTSHGAIKINMLLHLVDNTGLPNHFDFTSKIKGKETPSMINSILLKL